MFASNYELLGLHAAAALLVAYLIKVVIDRLKIFYKKGAGTDWTERINLLLSLALGILASFAFKIDLLTPVMPTTNLYAAFICTGFLIGGGSNAVNDFLRLARNKPSA